MLLLQPDSWPSLQPISLLSGDRLVHIWNGATVYALQRAGVPFAQINRTDYVRFLKLYPGPDGQPTHEIPASVDVADPTR